MSELAERYKRIAESEWFKKTYEGRPAFDELEQKRICEHFALLDENEKQAAAIAALRAENETLTGYAIQNSALRLELKTAHEDCAKATRERDALLALVEELISVVESGNSDLIDVALAKARAAAGPEPREEISLGLRAASWKNLFECLHVKGTHIESSGNFWAAVQHLQAQLEDALARAAALPKWKEKP